VPVAQGLPSPGGSGIPQAQWARSTLCRWPGVFSRPVVRRCPAPGGSGIPESSGLEVPFAGGPGFSPDRWSGGAPRRVAPGFPSPPDLKHPFADGPGFSPDQWPEGSPRRVAPGFPSPPDSKHPFAGWLRDSPSPVDSKYPFAAALVNFLRPMARGNFPIAGWLRVSSSPMAPGLSSPEAWRRPLPGGSGFLPRRWLRGFPLCQWLGFPLRRLPFPVVRKFLRLFVPAAQGVSATNFKILWPSTSHPQLTRGCPPRQTFLHRILHSLVHRLG
jgi:hypothetical protein